VGHIINEVWQTTSVAKTKYKPNNLWLPKFGLVNCGWEPNKPLDTTISFAFVKIFITRRQRKKKKKLMA
jgi:hypothetical protein